jgi:hypothetical protein
MSTQQVLVCFAGSEDVSRFAVDHIAACEELGFGHTEGNAEGIFDEAHDEGCPDYVPANDKECADDPVFDISVEYANRTERTRVGRQC